MNKAHEVLKSIGCGYMCGEWAKSKRYNGPTRSKTEKNPDDAKLAGVATVLRDYFNGKNLAALKKRKPGNWIPYAAR